MINRYAIIIIIGIAMFFAALLLVNRYQVRSELFALEVKGKISKIEFREKKMPFFYIDSAWVYFGNISYTIDRFLDEGDSIAKKKNSSRIELFKKNDSPGQQKYLKVEEISI